MEHKSLNGNESEPERAPVDKIIKEWKRRKEEDEKEFLQQINDPEHIKKMEGLRGKTVTNELASA